LGAEHQLKQAFSMKDLQGHDNYSIAEGKKEGLCLNTGFLRNKVQWVIGFRQLNEFGNHDGNRPN